MKSYSSYIPSKALKLTANELCNILKERLGKTFDIAISEQYTKTAVSQKEIPFEIKSPVYNLNNTNWFKKANIVGINVRTIGSFWNILKYSLSLSSIQNAIHLLPIWEPGAVGSLYGISSWQLNPEFYSKELENLYPYLNTLESQLKAVINILHSMGKTVGMDIIPHTDRFSEIVLSNPSFFEWIKRDIDKILDHSDDLYLEVQDLIVNFIKENGAAVSDFTFSDDYNNFFLDKFSESDRLKVLFGNPTDYLGRQKRRVLLLKYLYKAGYEPTPATMGTPFRGLKLDTSKKYIDGEGLVWRDYLIDKPGPMSRVFGPLSRYKLYSSKDNNANWEIDFAKPLKNVWTYVQSKYAYYQKTFFFDFMRGDMSHVQIRKDGVPEKIDNYYDILGSVKNYIQTNNNAKYFGYMAESFLWGRDSFGYGLEIDHLEAADADIVLGDLQSTVLGSEEFIKLFASYRDFIGIRKASPCFTMITADKDDPRFDKFYQKGNIARFFTGIFLFNISSYMGLGFQTRDIHLQKAANEYYTKLYVFQESAKDKITTGPYIFGDNIIFFKKIEKIKKLAESISEELVDSELKFLLFPDLIGASKVLAWTQKQNPKYVFIVNLDTEKDIPYFGLPDFANGVNLTLIFSLPNHKQMPIFNGKHYIIRDLLKSGILVYKIS